MSPPQTPESDVFLPAATSRASPSQLGDPPVDGVRHAPQLVGVGLALLALPPLRQPLVEGLGVDELLVAPVQEGGQVVRGNCL